MNEETLQLDRILKNNFRYLIILLVTGLVSACSVDLNPHGKVSTSDTPAPFMGNPTESTPGTDPLNQITLSSGVTGPVVGRQFSGYISLNRARLNLSGQQIYGRMQFQNISH